MKPEFRNCKVIPLFTKDATRLARREYLGREDKYKYVLFDELEPYDETTFRNQHLYICSDDNIKEEDYFYDMVKVRKCKGISMEYIDFEDGGFCSRPSICKKIIATTDKSLNLPEIPEQFLKEFCKKNGIWEVEVEYEYYKKCMECNTEYDISVNECNKTHNCDEQSIFIFDRLKLNNNTINIKTIKQTWTRDEVEQLLHKAFELGQDLKQLDIQVMI